jgi:hypothetical protein
MKHTVELGEDQGEVDRSSDAGVGGGAIGGDAEARLGSLACCAVEKRGTLECRAVDLPVGSGDAEAEGGHWVSYDDLGGLGIEADVAQPADGELRVDVNSGARRCVRCAVGE